jgi:transcription initiation factor IIE alpha subunit
VPERKFKCPRCGAVSEKDDEGNVRTYIPSKKEVAEKKKRQAEKKKESEKKGFWD